jgi:hypothetical protein
MLQHQDFKEMLRSIRNHPYEVKSPIFLRAAKLFEQEVFHFTVDGEVLFEPEEYLSYEDALEKAAQIQPIGYDRFNPTGSLNPELFARVKNFIPANIMSSLELIITIGTEFDYFHSANAVFRLSHSGHVVCVSLDATINDHKLKEYHRRQYLRQQNFNSNHRKNHSMRKELSQLEKEIKSDFLVSPDDIESGYALSHLPIQIALLLISRLIDKVEGASNRVSFCRAVSL